MTSEDPSYRYPEEGSFLLQNNSIDYDKPFITYAQMIELMESRNIIVDDKDLAVIALQNFSYYSLVNGYKNTFIQDSSSDSFIDGTKFEELYTLHIIDTGLNNILFKYIIYLEKALKSRLSYLISEKYGVYTDYNNHRNNSPDDYLSRHNYSPSNNRRSDILRRLKSAISTERHNPSMAHYINNKNHVPAWILTTNIPYGLAIEWYGILKNDDKSMLCSTFIPNDDIAIESKKEFMRKALSLTKEYRNKIAHGNRTFNIWNLPVLPKNPLLTLCFNAIEEDEYNRGLGQNDLMAVILVIMVLFDDPFLLNNFYAELCNIILPYDRNDFKIANKTIYEILSLPNDFLLRLETLLKRKFRLDIEDAQ